MSKSTDVVEARCGERCNVVGIRSKTPVKRNVKKFNMFR